MSCSRKLQSMVHSELGEGNVTEDKRRECQGVNVSNDTYYIRGWRQGKRCLDLLFRGNFNEVIGAEGKVHRVEK